MLLHLLKTSNRFWFPAKHRKRTFPVASFLTVVLLIALGGGCNMLKKTENQGTPPSNNAGMAHDEAGDALAIHRRAIVIDLHADSIQRTLDEGLDLGTKLSDGHFDTARAKDGGLDAQFFSIWVEPELFGGGGASAIDRADKQIAAVKTLVERYPETWVMAVTAGDIRRAAAAGKLSALMGLEGGYAIDERIENVERYYKMGVRYISPAWSISTSWAGSSGDEEGRTRGLNDFGKQVVREMNRLGMMVDVSHVSDPTFWDIVNTSTRPVIASHSACRAIADVPRNLTDEMIRVLAKTGGVVCVIFYPEHIEPDWREKKKQVDAEIASLVRRASEEEKGDAAHKKLARDRVRREEYAKRLPPVSISRIVDHIDHIVKLAGIDHVGIGSDFDGVQALPADLKSVADLPNLTAELLRRGYSESDIDKILGGNVLRMMEAVEGK